MGKAIVCFSGGMDSAALLHICKDVLGDNVTAVIVDVPMMSNRIRDQAMFVASLLDSRLLTVKLDWNDLNGILNNDEERCFICKKAMYDAIKKIADNNGIKWILNGDNVDDLDKFRPGMKAARSAGIVSPFVEAGVKRSIIEDYVENLNLPFTLVKETCMITRYPIGVPVTPEDLHLVEDLEYAIRKQIGVKQLRVRVRDGILRIQTAEEEIPLLNEHHDEITECVKSSGFNFIIENEGYKG